MARLRRGALWMLAMAAAREGLAAAGLAASGQAASGQAGATSALATMSSTATLVVAPALVRSAAGELVFGLKAGDFRITDNGVEQKVLLDEVERQPVSLLVVLQTGGAGARQFGSYARLPTMLEYMAGGAALEAGVMTFDSVPEEVWSFTADKQSLKEAFAHPAAGDGGAAILDAVDAAVDLLSRRPAGRRRIILLLSQPQDGGSKARAEEVVRRLGVNDVTIFSVSFSPGKDWLKDQFTKPRHESAPYKMANHPDILHTFDLSTPLGVALKSMGEDSAAEIAELSGGEHVRFDGRRGLEEELGVLMNHIPNRYALSFHPSAGGLGFHAIQVEVVGHPAGLQVAARTGYWASAER